MCFEVIKREKKGEDNKNVFKDGDDVWMLMRMRNRKIKTDAGEDDENVRKRKCARRRLFFI